MSAAPRRPAPEPTRVPTHDGVALAVEILLLVRRSAALLMTRGLDVLPRT